MEHQPGLNMIADKDADQLKQGGQPVRYRPCARWWYHFFDSQILKLHLVSGTKFRVVYQFLFRFPFSFWYQVPFPNIFYHPEIQLNYFWVHYYSEKEEWYNPRQPQAVTGSIFLLWNVKEFIKSRWGRVRRWVHRWVQVRRWAQR